MRNEQGERPDALEGRIGTTIYDTEAIALAAAHEARLAGGYLANVIGCKVVLMRRG